MVCLVEHISLQAVRLRKLPWNCPCYFTAGPALDLGCLDVVIDVAYYSTFFGKSPFFSIEILNSVCIVCSTSENAR